MFTKYHSKYYATELTLHRASDSLDNLTLSLSNAKVDLNPHQIDAALFALKSPLSNGVILADEVGLGKTIEAGLVISQKWAERKRKILLIVPSSLRKQWNQELLDKFFIDSIIIEGKSYSELLKKGVRNPLEQKDKVIICSFNYVSKFKREISRIEWDLVIIDEAHRLRNVYKQNNKIANDIKEAIQPYPKILLTATPLQNSLMELYGLVSIIDNYVFGDKKSFREQFINLGSDDLRNKMLKKRLSPLCQRTLRKQVIEYVPYTIRKSIVREYYPTDDEMRLYVLVSEYLRRDNLYALPNSQRHLMTLVLRKLLASSTYAITDTLQALVRRLDEMLINTANELIDDEIFLGDYDSLDELKDEWIEDVTKNSNEKEFVSIEDIEEEKQELLSYIDIANRIKQNTKGTELLIALREGFANAIESGANEKVVIFTESRRTQEYLFNLLSESGYENEVVMINGSNSDPYSRKIYQQWIDKNEGKIKVSGSRTADMKAAIVEEFRNKAKILIATEAAAEGINLQFCSLLVNFDLPWNPQRIEQRIGRCHRYGQKNDVVVINFINMRNEADKRVYHLLDEKYKLFDGIFGASDEVLGAIESGVDFERKISEIYETCRSVDEIELAFNTIQRELEEEIISKLSNTKEALLENFDEEVHQKLKGCKEETDIKLSNYQYWMLGLVKSLLYNDVEVETDNSRFYYKGNRFENNYYDFNWKRADENNSIFFRRDGMLINSLLDIVNKQEYDIGNLDIDYTSYRKEQGKISVYENLSIKTGWLIIDKLIVNTFDLEERLIFTAVADSGEILDEDLSKKLLYIPSIEKNYEGIEIVNKNTIEDRRKQLVTQYLKEIESKNIILFNEQEEKLDNWADDLKKGLETEIKDIEIEIKILKKQSRGCNSLEEKINLQKKIKEMEKRRNTKRRDLYDEQDMIENQKDELIAKMEAQLKSQGKVESIMKLRWNLV